MPEIKEIEMRALIEELTQNGYLLDESEEKKGFYEILRSFDVPVGSIDTKAQNVVVYIDFEASRVADETFSAIVKKYLPEKYQVPIIPEHLKATAA